MGAGATIGIGALIAVIGCFVGLAGWLSGRDKKTSDAAEWRGMITAKLDVIVGIRSDVADLRCTVNDQGKQIVAVQSSADQAHHRIDEIIQKRKWEE